MNLSIVKKKNIQHFLFLTTGCDANHLKTGFLWGGGEEPIKQSFTFYNFLPLCPQLKRLCHGWLNKFISTAFVDMDTISWMFFCITESVLKS